MFDSLHNRRLTLVLSIAAIVLTLASRIAVARFLPNDGPGDGVLYAQMARNILEQHVFSADDQPPFAPTLIRLPGYPVFLAGVYAVFGHGNNTAVRIVQAFIDTASCVLIALIAFNWDSDERRRRSSAAVTFLMAALCPFMIIFTATILTETITVFLVCAMTLTATYAMKSNRRSAASFWWITTGLLGGICVTFRPDAGLFLGAIGLTLICYYMFASKEREKFNLPKRLSNAVLGGALLTAAFAAVLAPWAVRNERLFHVFQPLAPAHAEMPGEFVPFGYHQWLRTWINDQRYIEPMLWSLDDKPIKIDSIPERAFDSPDQKARVAALLDQYNHPQGAADTAKADTNDDKNKDDGNNSSDSKDKDDSADSNDNDNSDDSNDNDNSTDSNDNDNSSGDDNSSDDNDSDDNDKDPPALVAMTPEIDAGFAQIAAERIAHSRFHYFVSLPVERAVSMWFDTHSVYFPFDGEIFPISDMDGSTHQNIWLPLFMSLVWIYTGLGLWGAWILFRETDSRLWVLFAFGMMLPRIVFFASIENPEPRYVIELFAFMTVFAGIAIARLFVRTEDSSTSDNEADLESEET